MDADRLPGVEVEKERLDRLAELSDGSDPDWMERFQPGSLGCHELLDRCSTLAESIEHLLLSHPSCVIEPEWYALADRAAATLRELYQRIGSDHLEIGVAASPHESMKPGR
jgi:hypothetical protein